MNNEQQVIELVEELSRKTMARLDEERACREEVERKLNRLRLAGGGVSDGDDPVSEFKAAFKTWYPSRDYTLDDYALYRKAFARYVRQGVDVLSDEERKALQAGIDPDGGYLAPSELSRTIIRVESDNSVMRRLARIVPIGAGSAEFPASLTRPETGWVGETSGRTATSTPTVGKIRFEAKEIYSMPEATQQLIDDAVLDIERFLGEEIGMAFAEEEDAQFIAGDGIVEPRGFTTYTTEATADSAGTRAFGTIEHIATGVSGNWPATDATIYDKMVDVVHALRPSYRRNAEWVMPTAAVSKLRKIKDSQNNPLWQQSLIAGQPDRFLGYPVNEAEQMPAIAANSLSVAFADWKRAYWIVDRMGVRVLRDPYTNKPYVRFYTTKRTSGGVADSAAIKLLKFGTA